MVRRGIEDHIDFRVIDDLPYVILQFCVMAHVFREQTGSRVSLALHHIAEVEKIHVVRGAADRGNKGFKSASQADHTNT